jgi:hypothetical protein
LFPTQDPFATAKFRIVANDTYAVDVRHYLCVRVLARLGAKAKQRSRPRRDPANPAVGSCWR